MSYYAKTEWIIYELGLTKPQYCQTPYCPNFYFLVINRFAMQLPACASPKNDTWTSAKMRAPTRAFERNLQHTHTHKKTLVEIHVHEWKWLNESYWKYILLDKIMDFIIVIFFSRPFLLYSRLAYEYRWWSREYDFRWHLHKCARVVCNTEQTRQKKNHSQLTWRIRSIYSLPPRRTRVLSLCLIIFYKFLII